jgi:hypothetical protein
MRTIIWTISAMFWLLASGPLSPVSAATAYRCTLPDGQVVYTELPPAGARCQALTTRGYSPSTPSGTPPAATPPPDSDESQTEPEVVPDEQQQQRQRACTIARRNLGLLESDQPVVRTNAEGEQVVLDDEQRAAALAQARKDVDYWCDDAP